MHLYRYLINTLLCAVQLVHFRCNEYWFLIFENAISTKNYIRFRFFSELFEEDYITSYTNLYLYTTHV